MGLHPRSPLPLSLARLARLSRLVPVEAPVHIRNDRKVVSFTFDDFPKSAVYNGARLLNRRDWQGTFYACGAFAGKPTHHGEAFDAHDLRKLVARHHEIGCHTLDHLNCVVAGAQKVADSVDANARAMRLLGCEMEMSSFAFPYGDVSPWARRVLKDRFTTLRGIRDGVNVGRADRTQLKAVGLGPGEAGRNKALYWMEELQLSGGWLVFFTHDIDDHPTRWGMTLRDFEWLLDAVERRGFWVRTMAEGARMMIEEPLPHAEPVVTETPDVPPVRQIKPVEPPLSPSDDAVSTRSALARGSTVNVPEDPARQPDDTEYLD